MLGLGVKQHTNASVPLTIPGCQLWLRGDLGTTFTGSLVTTWKDQSGNGHNVIKVAGSGANFNAADSNYNNQSDLNFPGTTNLLTNTNNVSLNQPCTIILAFNFDGSTNPQGAFTMTTNALIITNNAGTANGYLMTDGTGSVAGTFGSSNATPVVLAAVFNGASSALYINNSQTPLTTGTISGNGLGDFVIAEDSNNHFLNGNIAEVIIYNSTLTKIQMASVFSYLGNRYKISTS